MITPDTINTILATVEYDYEQCMQHPFFMELYATYSSNKSSKRKGYCQQPFSTYLRAAHHAHHLYTTLATQGHTLEESFDATFHHTHTTCYDQGTPFTPEEVYYIIILAYALLQVKSNPPTPFTLIEYYEEQTVQHEESIYPYLRKLAQSRGIHVNLYNMPILHWTLVKCSFYDYDMAGSIQKHLKQVPLGTTSEEVSPEAVPSKPLVRLNIKEGKHTNNIINTIRIFNVLHELDFFTDANGQRITKDALFNALATYFDCPKLTDWANRKNSSKGQAKSDYHAELKIFDTLKQAQETYLDKLDEETEKRYG